MWDWSPWAKLAFMDSYVLGKGRRDCLFLFYVPVLLEASSFWSTSSLGLLSTCFEWVPVQGDQEHCIFLFYRNHLFIICMWMLIHQTHMLDYPVHVAKSVLIKVFSIHSNIFWMISNEFNCHFCGFFFFFLVVFSMLVKKRSIGKPSTLCSIYELAAGIQSNPCLPW